MTSSKIIKQKNSLFVLSNTNNLTNYLAASMILPKAVSPKCLTSESFAASETIYAFETFTAAQTSFTENYRDSDNAFPVIIEVDLAILNFFKPKLKIKKQKENDLNFYLMPFVPIYFVNSVHFKYSKDMEDFMDIKFSNIDKHNLLGGTNSYSISIKVTEDYFSSDDIDTPSFSHEHLSDIPISQINTLDSIIGGIQLLMYVAKKEHSSKKTKYYITLIENLINKDKDSLVTDRFGFDVLSTINKGISSLSINDSLDVKIFKTCLIKLVSEAYQDINFGVEFIEEIIDMIPGSLLSDEENQDIDIFLDFIDGINSGSQSLPMNIFKPTKDQSLIRTCLILLMTQVGQREFLDILDMHAADKLDEAVFISSILLFGLFRNYSGLDNSFKKESNLRNISLIASPLLSDYISDERIEKSLQRSPNQSSKWWELLFNNKEIVSIQMDDPFYTSIIAQAAEAGFNFVDEGEEEYIYTPSFGKDKPKLYMQKGSENFFRIKTQPLLKNSALKKLKKEKILSLLVHANNINFRSSLVIQANGSLVLKRDQLSSTLDIPEIDAMINNLSSDYLILKEAIES
jgi:hypothetical protein